MPSGLTSACAAACLTLLDLDVKVWLEPSFTPQIQTWLLFHTGCRFTQQPEEADFALIQDLAALPELSSFNWGTAEQPEASTTLLVQVESWQGGQSVVLTGPGILDKRAIAHTYNIPLASHDDDSEAKVVQSQRRQVAIAEFPATIALAAQSRSYGAAVLMGAPNLVRGGSHVGYMSVAEAAKNDVLDCLCSDYHYPSLFHAPFKLNELGLMSFETAWAMVSSRPAAAVGISDRKGKIAPGLDADFLLISPHNSLPSAIASVYVTGKEVARYSIK